MSFQAGSLQSASATHDTITSDSRGYCTVPALDGAAAQVFCARGSHTGGIHWQSRRHVPDPRSSPSADTQPPTLHPGTWTDRKASTWDFAASRGPVACPCPVGPCCLAVSRGERCPANPSRGGATDTASDIASNSKRTLPVAGHRDASAHYFTKVRPRCVHERSGEDARQRRDSADAKIQSGVSSSTGRSGATIPVLGAEHHKRNSCPRTDTPVQNTRATHMHK